MENKNVSLQISAYSYKCITEISDKKYKAKYKTIAKKLGQMILKNGLIQTLVFLHSKNKDEHKQLIKHLVKWWEKTSRLDGSLVTKEIDYEDEEMSTANQKALEKVTQLSSKNYKLYTKESLKLSIWLARLADGMIADEE
ncbi:type III-B CRISPR module-associated protein Cmr5 [Orenia metallireducens]|uniref:CRISPR type III-B/RAMP module-associated protein Cmr5 n=1 Tax=Orenia metallireducens TaxID=1413210 RepID=A0A1C0A8E6_9FIRM|nr:type III-B CRISPR module-associated protein Cmr5 [Orenia metallireducens]OCL26490.1 type III-B CRISPR module-associated protein Cmr5 [Orenia metallireducens]